MFDLDRFVEDLQTLVGFETVVCRNPTEFRRAGAWIREFFDGLDVEFVDFECHGLTTTIIKPGDSRRPRVLGDGHIEVVPADDALFDLREEGGILYGRGVADMKTQCLMMMYVLRRLLREGDHHDFWLVLSEDEEMGSEYGVELVVDWLEERDLLPPVVFAPDGGPDFSYVEKEKGLLLFEATVEGEPAHASRPYLGHSAIDGMMTFQRVLRRAFPNPESQDDWRPSLSMTTISAGSSTNQIPGRCVAGFDMRLTEEEQIDETKQRLRRLAAAFEDAEDSGPCRVSLEFGTAAPATHYRGRRRSPGASCRSWSAPPGAPPRSCARPAPATAACTPPPIPASTC